MGGGDVIDGVEEVEDGFEVEEGANEELAIVILRRKAKRGAQNKGRGAWMRG